MDATIEARGLRKRYGSTVAVDNLSFTVTPGRVTGFVGPKGAGKSTTFRMILALDTPDEGTALIGGRPYHTLRTPLRHVGALLDAAAMHPSRRGRDHLLWMARANGVASRRVDEVIELVGVTSVARQRAGGLSSELRQRLGIAGALLGDPPVLLLDDPVDGLRADGAKWLHSLLRRLAAQGRAVVISSNLINAVEGSADHLIAIGRGRLVADTSVDELVASVSADRVTLRTTRRSEAMTVLANAGATVAAVDRQTLTVSGVPAERVNALLNERDVPFVLVAGRRPSLDEAYMEFTRHEVDPVTPGRQETQ